MRPHRSKSAPALAALLLGLASLPARAEPPTASVRCASCHPAEAAPLAKSRHGLASGPGLWGQLPTAGPHLGSSLACLSCHAPAPDQQPWRTVAPLAVDAGPGQTDIEAKSLALAGAAVEANPGFDPHAKELGVSCAACHVEAGQILGPREAPRAPHPVKVAELDDVARCAGCHQFGSASSVNGKPLENLVAEFRTSAWAQAGATCVSCHLPDGRHLFQGIHAPDLVAASVEVRWRRDAPGEGEIALTNAAVGHDFPSYVTPRVVLSVQPEDAQGHPVGAPSQQVLGRAVRWAGERWQEDSDTRVPPGGTVRLRYRLALPPSVARLHATVSVEPDAAYVRIFSELLAAGGLPAERERDLRMGLAKAQTARYEIFDETQPR
ncbi:MAG: cytochrome c3 family protein [Deltaproteobacteria bacterium]|nr:cytochrome c3 family protein [Deltaproteobacteria bacterium]